jgi:hypothetical protein
MSPYTALVSGIDRLRREVEREQKQAARKQRRSARRLRRGRRIRIAAIAAAVTLAAGAGIAAWWAITGPSGSSPPVAAGSGPGFASASASGSPEDLSPSVQVTVAPPVPDGAFPPSADRARQELGRLTVARNQDSAAYQRSAFGPGWGGYGYYPKLPDGCEARDEVLRRDLSDVVAGDRNTCIIFSGVLHDPYTGKELPYSRYKASDINIDHVVALGAAWRSGASKWTAERRVEFANDSNNMLAVDKQANNDKGSKTPDQWRPPRDFWCPYAERWVGIKDLYGLTVTTAEKTALEQMLENCG